MFPSSSQWVLIRFMLGTKEKNLKFTAPKLKRKKKKKKSRHFECMLSLPIGCMRFLFPKLFVTIFGLGHLDLI
jgi:hypothetical protein